MEVIPVFRTQEILEDFRSSVLKEQDQKLEISIQPMPEWWGVSRNG